MSVFNEEFGSFKADRDAKRAVQAVADDKVKAQQDKFIQAYLLWRRDVLLPQLEGIAADATQAGIRASLDIIKDVPCVGSILTLERVTNQPPFNRSTFRLRATVQAESLTLAISHSEPMVAERTELVALPDLSPHELEKRLRAFVKDALPGVAPD